MKTPKKTIGGISEPSLKRLPLYLRHLESLDIREYPNISCSHIAAALKANPTQVRKDLACAGAVGKPKVGYDTGELRKILEEFLGLNNVKDAFLVGAGNLGKALLGYDKFAQRGLNICAAFDVDEELIGETIHGKPVLSTKKLPGLAVRMNVNIGILVVPEPVAQETCDLLIESGVKAIWNFSPVVLKVPEDIVVQNEDLYASLAVLTNKLKARMES